MSDTNALIALLEAPDPDRPDGHTNGDASSGGAVELLDGRKGDRRHESAFRHGMRSRRPWQMMLSMPPKQLTRQYRKVKAEYNELAVMIELRYGTNPPFWVRQLVRRLFYLEMGLQSHHLKLRKDFDGMAVPDSIALLNAIDSVQDRQAKLIERLDLEPKLDATAVVQQFHRAEHLVDQLPPEAQAAVRILNEVDFEALEEYRSAAEILRGRK